MRARGRAIVESPTKSGAPLRFTVPVEVAPHSAQQIYSILSDESVNEPRAVVFRAFELAGAVASAYALSFGADILTKDAIQLSTGIGVPAFSKFWTDRLPGYQRNIVNFAMDDLVKIPKGGVTSHKFLFFPKDKIEGMIIDQHSYAERTFTQRLFSGVRSGRATDSMPQPTAFVAYLTFDNLDIPFENVFQPEPANDRQRLLDLNVDINTQLARRTAIRDTWLSGSSSARFAGLAAKSSFDASDPKSAVSIANAVKASWTALVPDVDASSNLKKQEVLDDLEVLTRAMALLAPDSVRNSELIAGDSIKELELAQKDLEDIRSRVLGGAPASRYLTRIQEVEAMVALYASAAFLYDGIAATVADDKFLAELTDSLKPGTPAAAAGSLNKAVSAANTLRTRLQKLGAMRGKNLQDKILSDLPVGRFHL